VMDRVVYVASGRAASGTTDEVVREDVLSALYGQHVDVLHLQGRILVVAGKYEAHHVELEGTHSTEPGAAPRGLG